LRLRAGTRIVDLQRELVAAREELREQATKDFLTRIWNRSSILDVLQRELVRGNREKRPIGVVLADLDHFKPGQRHSRPFRRRRPFSASSPAA